MELVVKQVADIAQIDITGTVLDAEGGAQLRDAVQAHIAAGKRRFVVNVTDVGHISGDAASCLVDARIAVLAAGGYFALVLPEVDAPEGSAPSSATWRYDTVEEAIASLLRE